MDIKQKVKDTIVNLLKVKPQEVKEGLSLEDSLGVDSTEMVEMVIAMGKAFNVKLETKDITKHSKVEDIEAIIKAKIGG